VARLAAVFLFNALLYGRALTKSDTVHALFSLKRLGFSFENQCGSHVRLAKNGLRVTIPMHDALVPKTLQSILRQADISIEKLMEEIR
jgi:predicted RNA binding protein YcfA (HicA-like mRNA interferase family)